MANGTTRREIARADRMRELDAQERQATKNALNNLRNAATSRDLPPYRDEQDSGEITANVHGLHAKGVPREAWRWIGIGIAAFITLAGVALVVALL
jgi:hypothetical protein